MQTVPHNMLMEQKNTSSGLVSIQISITPPAKGVIDRLVKKTEIPQKHIMSRIFEWFAQLPPAAQKSVLWPEETTDDMDATVIALEFLRRRRVEVAARETASKSVKKAVSKAVKSQGPQSGQSESGGQSLGHKTA